MLLATGNHGQCDASLGAGNCHPQYPAPPLAHKPLRAASALQAGFGNKVSPLRNNPAGALRFCDFAPRLRLC